MIGTKIKAEQETLVSAYTSIELRQTLKKPNLFFKIWNQVFRCFTGDVYPVPSFKSDFDCLF